MARTPLLAVAAAVLLLNACGHNDTSEPGLPQNFLVTAGDTQAVVTWDMDPSLQYWIFSAQAQAISLNTYFSDPGARVTTPAYSPQIIGALGNGLPYSFIMNATRNGGMAGPTTASQVVTPLPGGNNWVNNTGGGLPTTINFNSVSNFGRLFVAVGQGGAIFSTTYTGVGGITWSAENSPTTANLNAVTVAGGGFVAVGDGGTVVFSVAVVNGAATQLVWAAPGAGPDNTANLHGVVLTNQGTFVAVGDNGVILTTGTLTSPWTPVVSGTTETLLHVANISGNLVATGANGTVLLSATSGVSWVPVAVPALPAGASLHGTAASVNLFTPSLSNVVIIGDQGIALRTLDLFGLTGLTLQPAFTSSNLLAICFGSRYVTVGQNGAIFHSADGNGTSWMAGSVTPAPITQNLNSVSFGAGLYVAVGDAGANAFSSN